MTTANAELMKNAREKLSDKWNLAIPTYLVYMLLAGAGGGISLIIGGPMQLGASIFSLNLAENKKPEFAQILDGFKRFADSLVAYLLMVLYIMLWSLLFIIPGIVAAIAYSQTFFILAENPKMKGAEALQKSKEIMRSYKWKYFCLGWRFFGWAILSVLTLGIGFLWLVPYMQVTYANFYNDIKKLS